MMKNPRILAIDLGSSYTKVAVRSGWNSEAILLDRLPLSVDDLSYCVPSVVVKVRRGSEDIWLTGAAASERRRGDGVTIYRRWKAGLFPPDDIPPVSGASALRIPDRNESTEVAVQFFSQLREGIVGMRREADLTRLPVRVCVPRFGDFSESESIIKEVLIASGWACPDVRMAISEPESNVLGLLTRGCNATWMPPVQSYRPLPELSIHMPRMIKSAQMLTALHNMTGCYAVLVADIGAYTTDFGYVRFDTTFETDLLNRPEIIQKSYARGIGSLDAAVFNGLSTDKQNAIRNLSTAHWEKLKPALYRGEEVAIPNPTGGVLKIGRGPDAAVISNAVADFARAIWQLRAEFLADSGLGQLHCQALTGGGALIPGIRNILRDLLADEAGGDTIDLLGAFESPDAEGHAANLFGTDDAYALKTQELMRGGSAVGGTSVFFE